ncbi:tol-pal system protein YbgF [Desulfuromonas carbonis]|uniref:tol-pal system protein YbgF n=1 Tax=Desulfuromonas sp. DDH964 TaxID=1823759 RepID=UPI00078C301C|nr:tol-pal system protein YbgF [Desulfuromonas sp. DDH964]AMV70423.1 lipoprotein [Desulfuromonas sp. DDH964]
MKGRQLVWAGVLVLLLGGCVATPQQQRAERDLEEMKRRLADLERAVAARQQDQGLEGRLGNMARQQADLQVALDALRVELQKSNGRLEELSHQDQSLRDDLTLLRDDLGLKVAALEERVGKLASAAPPVVAPAAVAVPAPEALYEEGLQLIQKQGEFARGMEVLRSFLQRYPQHELAVNAQYWIGEAFYGEKKYENAILQFQDVIQKYPGHAKAPAALLKQGLAFHALGDIKNARVILQKVIDSYPKSEEAGKARERLAQWPAR